MDYQPYFTVYLFEMQLRLAPIVTHPCWMVSYKIYKWRLAMALPIAATPVLKGREASDFLRRIESDLQKPLNYTPTPKLGKAKELVKEYVAKGSKRDHR